jgi:hypothetical protein
MQSKQRGNVAVIMLGAVLGILLTIGGTFAYMYFHYANFAVTSEENIKKTWSDSQNVLAQYSLKIGEMAQVPAMYKKDLQDVYTAALSGRYGKDGSKAVFQFLKEQNPNLDPKLYRSVQEAMEAGRNKFEASQRLVLEHTTPYAIATKQPWSKFWLGIAGYPSINLDDYKVIQSEHSQETFKTGVDKGITLPH